MGSWLLTKSTLHTQTRIVLHCAGTTVPGKSPIAVVAGSEIRIGHRKGLWQTVTKEMREQSEARRTCESRTYQQKVSFAISMTIYQVCHKVEQDFDHTHPLPPLHTHSTPLSQFVTTGFPFVFRMWYPICCVATADGVGFNFLASKSNFKGSKNLLHHPCSIICPICRVCPVPAIKRLTMLQTNQNSCESRVQSAICRATTTCQIMKKPKSQISVPTRTY